MSIRFLGLSGHLRSGAPGHFETFHKGIFHAFKELIGEEDCVFLGSHNSEGTDEWFVPSIPNSFTSTISWAPRGFLTPYLEFPNSCDEAVILYIYEGNIANLFLLGSYARGQSNIVLFFNLFNSLKYRAILESKVRLWVFKRIVLLAMRGLESKVILTGDTKKFAKLLSDKTGQSFFEYPIYSALEKESVTSIQRKRILINFRGEKSEELFLSALSKYPELQSIEFDLHGVHDQTVVRKMAEFSNLRLLPDQLDEPSYFSLYNDYCTVAFIYDPEFFSMQSSGRLADAIVAGAKIVVPRDTSLEDILSQYGNGNAFDFNCEKSFADALMTDSEITNQTDCLPTSRRAAEMILSSAKSALTSQKKSIQARQGILDVVLDEGIRGFLWCIRLIYGVKNHAMRFLNRRFSRVSPEFE